jgi:purine catabolism regulator
MTPGIGSSCSAIPAEQQATQSLGSLVLGADKSLTPAQNSVVSSVVGLLELLVRQRTSGSLAPSQLATAAVAPPRHTGRGAPGS